MNETLSPGALPPGTRIYAIGDVHGCIDQLDRLHAQIAADLRRRPVPEATLLYIGDLIDRGPDSAAVVERLLSPPPVPVRNLVCLLGNHEAMMLDLCAPKPPRDGLERWLENGGSATLGSYGIAAHAPLAEVVANLPAAHLGFLRGCPLRFIAGDYLFVHAGIRPGVPLNEQNPLDLLWIREPFLSSEENFPLVVVHGHTPVPEPELQHNRICIDTGACFGGWLTCAVLEDDRIGFLQT